MKQEQAISSEEIVHSQGQVNSKDILNRFSIINGNNDGSGMAMAAVTLPWMEM